MPFESKNTPLLPRRKFYNRMLRSFLIASTMIFCSLFLGILGYHFICKLSWIDSLLNASMILTGMGPVNQMETDASKLFASFYALYSGIAFLSTVAVFIAPLAHRLMHRFHLEKE
jgi:ABC-type glycerol-3-phosphate transport system permease component